jgi:hypothetical protein
MSTVQEIERAITKLSTHELEELHMWMEEQYPQPIDSRLAADLNGGQMDARIRQALAEHHDGTTRAL